MPRTDAAMLLTLSASCLKSLIKGKASKVDPRAGASPLIELVDLPMYTRERLGLVGLNLSTDLLAGADRRTLETLRERADKAACTCLLLTEPEPQALASTDPAKAQAAVARCERVIEAAQILGCSAASLPVLGADDDDAMERAIERLKPVVARAEKRDLSLLIAPTKGLTERPERVTELLKRVGGFRIGTFPDFQFASMTADAPGYLHRLTPYATIVCASTVSFAEPGSRPMTKSARSPRSSGEDLVRAALKAAANAAATQSRASKSKPAPTDDDDDESPAALLAQLTKPLKARASKAAAAAEGAAAPDANPDAAPDAKPRAKSRKGKAASAPTPPPPPPKAAARDDDDDDDDEGLDPDALEAALDADDDGFLDIDPSTAPIHDAYDLDLLLESILAVGYDGPLTLDYRGKGADPTAGIIQSRDALLAALLRVEGPA